LPKLVLGCIILLVNYLEADITLMNALWLVACLYLFLLLVVKCKETSVMPDLMPGEVMDMIFLGLNPHDAISVLAISKWFYKRYSHNYHDIYHENINGDYKLGLYKIYMFWKYSENPA